MRRRRTVAAAAAAALALVATLALASSAAAGSTHHRSGSALSRLARMPLLSLRKLDNDDSVFPAGAAITATSKRVVFDANVNGAVTITCTTSTFKFTTPAAGLGPVNLTAIPVFGGCADSRGGVDAVTANAANGPWTLLFLDSKVTGEETQAEPNAGDLLKLTMPRAGLTASSSILPGCVVTGAPAAPASLLARYDDVSKAMFPRRAFPVAGAGCITTGTATITADYLMAPNFTDSS